MNWNLLWHGLLANHVLWHLAWDLLQIPPTYPHWLARGIWLLVMNGIIRPSFWVPDCLEPRSRSLNTMVGVDNSPVVLYCFIFYGVGLHLWLWTKTEYGDTVVLTQGDAFKWLWLFAVKCKKFCSWTTKSIPESSQRSFWGPLLVEKEIDVDQITDTDPALTDLCLVHFSVCYHVCLS